MLSVTNEKKIHYTLRLAAGMCFIGHGAFGIITKPIWANYFAVFGISNDVAYNLMPWVGVMDIFLGISILIYPTKAVITWLIVWSFITALLRPLSGEPFAEFIERAGNYGAPLTLLLLSGFPRKKTDWLREIKPDKSIGTMPLKHIILCLRIVVFLLLLGHGWLNLIDKKSLLDQYTSLGFSSPTQVSQLIGLFEVIAAVAILIRPLRPFILIVLAWKIVSELFYPKYEAFEWIERSGSYCSLLALWFALSGNSYLSDTVKTSNLLLQHLHMKKA
jgi:hypothetical protein